MSEILASWLVKQEPGAYPFSRLVEERRTVWDGVRNAQARLHLLAMAVGDVVLYYHSGDEKAVVGIARVSKSAFPDPGADDPRWVAVELEAVKPLAEAVSLAAIKSEPKLAATGLVRQSRLSVMPLTAPELALLCAMGKTRLTAAGRRKR